MGNQFSELDSVSGKFAKFTDHQFLPDDTLISILTRLDVRDVVRCRFVCKKLKDLTSDPQFENSLLLMPPSNIPMIFTKHSPSMESCIDKWWRSETIFQVPYSRHAEQMSSQNGFILMQSNHLLTLPYEYIVRNPMTGEQVTIFLHKESLPKCCVFQRNDIFGIFLHPITRNEYCTLWRVTVAGVGGVHHTQYKMLNLGSAQPTCWRNIGPLWSHGWVYGTNVVCLDGLMYWLVRQNDNEMWLTIIIEFDMKTEDMKNISLPSTDIDSQFKYPSNLVNADGSLSIVQVEVDEVITVKMWTLKDPKTRFWTASQYVLGQVQCPPKLWSCWMYQSPRAIAIVNCKLAMEGNVEDDGSKGLFVCNLETGTMRELGENKYPSDARFLAHHPTIASLRNCHSIIQITQESI